MTMIWCRAERSLACVVGLATAVWAAACGRIYGDAPSDGAFDGGADAPMMQTEGSSEAGADDVVVPVPVPIPDASSAPCSSAAPKCTGEVLANLIGDPNSVVLLGDSLYWSDHSSKTIQRIPTQTVPASSTAIGPAAGIPSRLAIIGAELAWFVDTLAGTGMPPLPPHLESGNGDTLKVCSPDTGCAVSARSVEGTSAPASDGDGGIAFGTVGGLTARAILIPRDFSSTASQDLTGPESSIVNATYALGSRLVWITSAAVNVCSFADCMATRSLVASLVGMPTASAAGNNAVVWVTGAPPMVTVTGMTASTDAGGNVSYPVRTLVNMTTDVTAVFVDGDYVILASSGTAGPGLYRCPLTGCGPTKPPELVALGGAAGARFIAADGKTLYWFVPVSPGAFTVYRALR